MPSLLMRHALLYLSALTAAVALSSSAWSQELTLESPYPSSGGMFGWSLSAGYDVDGDGISDVAVGAPHEGSDESGHAYIFSGSTGALIHHLASLEPEFGGGFGASVALIGDVNGDGIADLAVGAAGEDVGPVNYQKGRVYVFSGATGAVIYSLRSPSPEVGGRFGSPVSALGDVNGDGVNDFAAGSNERNGRVYVIDGPTGAIIYSVASPLPFPNGRFGLPLAPAHDMDGDDIPDLIVGDREADNGTIEDAGQVYLLSGATGDLIRTFDNPDPQPHGAFGHSVLFLGDVDNDGTADIAVGSDKNIMRRGAVHLMSGATGGVIRTFTSPNSKSNGRFGQSIASTGDLDDDGTPDLVIGANHESAPASFAGRVYVMSGSTGAVILTLISPNTQQSGSFGVRVTAIGDGSGPPSSRVVVGARYEGASPPPPTGHGRAYVFDLAPTTSQEGALETSRSALSPPQPNPSAGRVYFDLAVERPQHIRAEAFDAFGRRVAVLFDGAAPTGTLPLTFSATTLPPGVYVVRVRGETFSAAQRVSVVR